MLSLSMTYVNNKAWTDRGIKASKQVCGLWVKRAVLHLVKKRPDFLCIEIPFVLS